MSDRDDLVQSFAEEDRDTCSKNVLTSLFPNTYLQSDSTSITKGDETCSPVACSSTDRIASVLSDSTISIIDKSSLTPNHKFKPHRKRITKTEFSADSNTLYSCSLDGTIKLTDIRTGKSELTFSDADAPKPFTTLSVSPGERLLCAGTELIGEDVFLLFYDLRSRKLSGGYWESHSNDVTHVAFNPTHPNLLASSAMDGLLNVFDVSQPSEDVALTYCLNAGEDLFHFSWLAESKSEILGYTDYGLQMWNTEGAAPTMSFARGEFPEEYIIFNLCVNIVAR